MSEETTLDQLLDDEHELVIDPEPEEIAEDVSEAEPEPEKKQDESEDSTGEEAGLSPEPDNELTDKEKAFLAKSNEEKRKRQALEQRVQELEAGAQPEPEKIDPIDDPEGFVNSVEARLSETELKTRISVSQALMRRQHDDYDDKEGAFLELAKQDPTLIQKMRDSDFPAEFVYQTATQHERFSKFESFDAAVADAVSKQKAEIEKSVRESLEKEYKDKLALAGSLPPSGADSSKGSDSSNEKDDSTEDLFGV